MTRTPERPGPKDTKVEEYKSFIIKTLLGQTPELEDIPPERLDWSGIASVVSLYNQAFATDRVDIVQAMVRIIEDAQQDPVVVAQVIDIGTNLEIPDLEPSVLKLQKIPLLVSVDFVAEAINNYLLLREFARSRQKSPRNMLESVARIRVGSP